MSDKATMQQGLTPVPDPTVLTTEQLHREIATAIRLQEAKLDALREVVDVRFLGVNREITVIEDHRIEQKNDTEKALVAALSAAKEAVKEQNAANEKSIIKTETSAAEQSKQQYATIAASLKGITDTLGDLKDRVVKIESHKIGATETRDTQRLDMGTILAILSLAAVVVFALIR